MTLKKQLSDLRRTVEDLGAAADGPCPRCNWQPPILLVHQVRGILDVRLHDAHDGCPVHKPSQVVDVFIGIVALDPVAQPEEMPHP